MHAALLQGRAAGQHGQAPTTTVIASSTIWVGPRPRRSGPSSQIDGDGDRRDRQPDARHGRAEREVEARLHAVAPGVADGRERLGQQHEQRDDHADRRLRRADGRDGVLDGRRLDFARPTTATSATTSSAEADQRRPADGGSACVLRVAASASTGRK